MFIEICGNIASGKTTLTELLQKNCNRAIFEDFHSNPFYKAFYLNAKEYSFETELTFHLQHYHAKKIEKDFPQIVYCDFSMLLDRAYADVTLSGKRHFLFTQISDELEEEIGPPTKIIRLFCQEEVLLARIIARNREPEKSITIDYLKSLTAAIDKRIEALASSQPNIKIINIDSHQYDFADDAKAQEAILKVIQET